MQFFSPIFIKVSTRQLLIYGNGRQLWCLWFHLDIYMSIHLCAVGIFHHFLWWVGWQEPGKLHKKIVLFAPFQSNFDVIGRWSGIFLTLFFSDCYNWPGCWWKPIRCRHRGSHVRAASFVQSLETVHSVLLTKPLLYCAQSSSTLHYRCRDGREEPGLSDIREDGKNCCLNPVLLILPTKRL